MTSMKFHNRTSDINSLWYDSHKQLIEKVAIELDVYDRVPELIETILGKEHKLKKYKDPNAPKRPKTGFLYFCDEFRPQITEKNPELKLGGIMKELGKLWGTYNDEEKEKYNFKYRESREKYEEELEEYINAH